MVFEFIHGDRCPQRDLQVNLLLALLEYLENVTNSDLHLTFVVSHRQVGIQENLTA